MKLICLGCKPDLSQRFCSIVSKYNKMRIKMFPMKSVCFNAYNYLLLTVRRFDWKAR